MLGYWSWQFSLFLKALDGEVCPLCAVRSTIETEEAARTARQCGEHGVMCGAHLALVIAKLSEAPARVALVRSILGASMNSRNAADCAICTTLSRAVQRSAFVIHWLDSRVRFQKAIEDAPLFCRDHVWRICDKGAAANFRGIQRRKVQKLINDLAQAQLRNRPEIQSLIEQAVLYLSSVPSLREPTSEIHSIESTQDPPETEVCEFVNWDRERQLEYLGKLESEAASLRYRNAVLTEENRALKVARIADQSIRRDLERDREELFAREAARPKKLQP
jgi:hypothetical protein